MKKLDLKLLGIAASALGFWACAHTPVKQGLSPDSLMEAACSPGHSNHTVIGSIWMKATSKEAKGQFPASVNASDPEQVTLEVTNLIGSPQATIKVDHGSYTIDMPDEKKGTSRKAQGSGSWGGIPLRWASELFLGRIPCPSADSRSHLTLSVQPDTSDLTAETAASPTGDSERFVYHFRQWGGKPWPESLHWERKGRTPTSVDFKFDDPDDKTGSPKKWEAKSPRGEVKLRWTDFRVSS